MQGNFKSKKYSRERMENMKPHKEYEQPVQQDIPTKDVVLWVFVLIAVLILGSVFLYMKTQFNLVCK